MKTNRILLFVSFIIVLTFPSVVSSQAIDKFVVVLDAGHGGKDPGNLGNGFREKEIALKVVLAVGKELEKHPNIEVIYTRKKDVFIDLFVRGKIANKANADLFVSVHCDSHTSQAYGAGTFVLGLHRNKTNFEVAKKENSVIFMEDDYKKNYAGFDPNSPEDAISVILGLEEYLDQSIYLASLIQDNFVKLNRKNRKVKQAGFIVLHQTVMPSVLVELGFLTNNREGKYLNSKMGQQQMSSAILDAILKYKKSLDLNTAEVLIENNDLIESEPMEFDNVVFKVQIAASSRKLMPKPYNFKGLDAISRTREGNLYKYFYGNTSDYNKTKSLVQQAKSKGYKSCFVVAFKDDKKVSLSEVLKTKPN
ncbi:N-acetylmuramoyl-L-alanine amidase [Algibacter sp. 2305UL17-15]|uniref:N-acetylmuramoyl-L-alanine amidase family protein n=1 Tax=Algibacter sp. 2305UL17-15 TaxID=3231268 RepID=UPI00345A1572